MEFHFLQTEDGSPSLKLGSDAEAMHNSKGAFSETVYIYGHALQAVIEKGVDLKVLSLGLGLGYNELLMTALALKAKIPLERIYGETFEAVPELNDNFLKWLANESIDQKFKQAYEKICGLCANETNVSPEKIKSTLLSLRDMGRWIFRDALTANTIFTKRFSCFLFDAFSSKTSPELWNENFLIEFFNQAADDEAVLSTYAFTGTLKRALQKTGFEVENRQGFAGKRESTFAVRKFK